MMLIEQKQIEAVKAAEYKRGFMDGVKLMEQRMIMAAESGKAIEKIDRADTISIEIHSDANKERYPFDEPKLQKETVFKRLNNWNDITAIEIKLVGDMDEESEPERYYYWTNWVGDDDVHNPAQSTYISELGHLYLVIAEGKGIEDFFNYGYINDARCVDHDFAMCDVGDKYSKEAEDLEKAYKESEEQTV